MPLWVMQHTAHVDGNFPGAPRTWCQHHNGPAQCSQMRSNSRFLMHSPNLRGSPCWPEVPCYSYALQTTRRPLIHYCANQLGQKCKPHGPHIKRVWLRLRGDATFLSLPFTFPPRCLCRESLLHPRSLWVREVKGVALPFWRLARRRSPYNFHNSTRAPQ